MSFMSPYISSCDFQRRWKKGCVHYYYYYYYLAPTQTQTLWEMRTINKHEQASFFLFFSFEIWPFLDQWPSFISSTPVFLNIIPFIPNPLLLLPSGRHYTEKGIGKHEHTTTHFEAVIIFCPHPSSQTSFSPFSLPSSIHSFFSPFFFLKKDIKNWNKKKRLEARTYFFF